MAFSQDQFSHFPFRLRPSTFPVPSSKESIIPKDVNFLVGYEAGHQLTESERGDVGFTRVEQLEQWFLASAPGNPVLLRRWASGLGEGELKRRGRAGCGEGIKYPSIL